MSWLPSSQWGMTDYSGIGNMAMAGQQAPMMGDSTAMAQNAPGGFQLGWNVPTMQMGMQGLNTIGNIWGAWQSNRLAKDQLNFTKKIATANLNNQVSSYNTALEDRSRARAAVEGQTSAEAQAYVNRNRLPGG